MNNASAYKYLSSHLAERLRGLSLSVRRPVEGNLQGVHPSPHTGASVEFSDYREYSPGDPPNLIDWAVYARSDRVMIRRFREETNLRAYLCLDISESLRFQGSGRMSKIEYASFLAAGLMYILVNQGDSAGMIFFDRELKTTYAPTSTLEGLRPMLLGLETITSVGAGDIEHALHQTAERIKARSLIILISDLLQNPAEILRGIRHLHHNGHDLMILHVLDAAELHFPLSGLTELRELETGHKLVVDTDDIRTSYRQAMDRHLDTLRRGCQNCRADYHLINTSQP
ncbi:MAG: DUF58 domain-containing protein, partial [Verrucomicrobia bacterium]|nr:DUF58 domain-containing protein [Verrucomicrobiota bacterium]